MSTPTINALGAAFQAPHGSVWIGDNGTQLIHQRHEDDVIEPALGLYFSSDGRVFMPGMNEWVSSPCWFCYRIAGNRLSETTATLSDALEWWMQDPNGREIIATIDSEAGMGDEFGFVRYVLAGPGVGLEEDLYPPMRAKELRDELKQIGLSASALERAVGGTTPIRVYAAKDLVLPDEMRARLRETLLDYSERLSRIARDL